MSTEENATTGAWIRAELDAKGWKVDDLSYAAHIPARLIWKYLAGTEPGAKNLARIVQAFGYDAPWTNASGDSSTARERSYAILGTLAASPDLALAGANG
jgi:transcriptional regulator with XRE-family HTH domain